MSVLQLFNNLSSTSSLNSVSAEWPGGDGWIIVDTGTFSGAAHLNFFLSIGAPWGIIAGLPPNPISAPGVYPFNAPKGLMNGSAIIAPGDSISNLTVYAVPMAGSDI